MLSQPYIYQGDYKSETRVIRVPVCDWPSVGQFQRTYDNSGSGTVQLKC